MKPKMPSIAARPLLISTLRRAFIGVRLLRQTKRIEQVERNGMRMKPQSLASLSEG